MVRTVRSWRSFLMCSRQIEFCATCPPAGQFLVSDSCPLRSSRQSPPCTTREKRESSRSGRLPLLIPSSHLSPSHRLHRAHSRGNAKRVVRPWLPNLLCASFLPGCSPCAGLARRRSCRLDPEASPAARTSPAPHQRWRGCPRGGRTMHRGGAPPTLLRANQALVSIVRARGGPPGSWPPSFRLRLPS